MSFLYAIDTGVFCYVCRYIGQLFSAIVPVWLFTGYSVIESNILRLEDTFDLHIEYRL